MRPSLGTPASNAYKVCEFKVSPIAQEPISSCSSFFFLAPNLRTEPLFLVLRLHNVFFGWALLLVWGGDSVTVFSKMPRVSEAAPFTQSDLLLELYIP